MIFSWLSGLAARRFWRVVGTIAGNALTVALLATLGIFVDESAATMTARTIAAVPVDWQIQMVPGADIAAVKAAAAAAAPITRQQTAGYAQIDGFEFTAVDGGTQVTGSGKAVGLDKSYFDDFPRSARLLAGDFGGALLLQQTAANLHAGPGDKVTLHRPGIADTTVTVTGVIDLKSADTFFQAVGVPSGASPQAPPDNAIILPLPEWRAQFDPQAAVRPDSVRMELHLGLDHAALPANPQNAFLDVTGRANNFAVRVAGSAVMADNLATSIDAARADALYSYVLFLFLGAPGVVLAGLLTLVIAASGAERRRRDQALLRIRGASVSRLFALAAVEAAVIGVVGAATGIVITALIARLALGLGSPTSASIVWLGAAALAGLLLASGAIIVPAWRSARALSVVAARQVLGTRRTPLWQQIYLDLVLLALAALVFWRTAATGYQVVLAPEGVSAISVDYAAFLAPFLLWVGGGLLGWRIADLLLRRGRKWLAVVLSPAGTLATFVAASMSRQGRRLAAGIALTGLAFAFASSTAIFNTTFEGQARVDAELTNGSDLTVTGTTAAPAGSAIKTLSTIPGVKAAEGMAHRYAYVGNDLQDLYGIDAKTIGDATSMANAYFAGGDAQATLAKLAATPAAVLVSDETVNDFQLTLGDTINLRLQGADRQYHVVPFTFAGIVREFPTAPRDSFLVANADYVAKMTGIAAREVVLMKVDGNLDAARAAAVIATKGLAGSVVSDLTEAKHLIGSSLTAIDLGGLTRLELVFALLMAAAATGLVLALGLADRRRGFAIMAALGAKPKVLAAFIYGEAAVVLGGGTIIGLGLGAIVAEVLVNVLQGVFDPPPEGLAVPWGYLVLLVVAALVANGLASMNAMRQSRIDPAERLRELQ
jgi:putative ABC transport system permease protein